MAATLTTQAVFDVFNGNYEDFKTFFHGHSFMANQLGAAASLASLKLLTSQDSIKRRHRLESSLVPIGSTRGIACRPPLEVDADPTLHACLLDRHVDQGRNEDHTDDHAD